YGVCEELRRLPGGASVPVVMITGLTDIDSLERAYEAGATDFITKPVIWDTLAYRVRYLLRAAHAIQALRESESELLRAQRVARLVHWEWDLVSGQINWSKAAKGVFGLDADKVWPNLRSFVKDAHPEDRIRLRESVENLRDGLSNGGPFSIEHRLLLGAEKEVIVEHQGELVRDPNGESIRWLGTMQDVSERKRAERQIHQLAYYDPLTALPNRELFRRRSERALRSARRKGSRVAFVFIDLDGFKFVNDSLGHEAGDELLLAVSDGLLRGLRGSDLVAKFSQRDTETASLSRFGGDEFVVLLPEMATPDAVATIVSRLLANVREPVKTHGREFEVTGSAGIAIFPDDGESVDECLKNADIAMYEAKHGGKNCYRFYTQRMDEAVQRRLRIESDLRKAISLDQLYLVYQPKVDLSRNAIVGVEALLRWQHPEFGDVPPTVFIPIAEETGIIDALGEWVLQCACEQARRWQLGELGSLQMAVNVSSHQIKSGTLASSVQRILKDTELDPRLLEFELTESILMDNTESTMRLLHNLKALGVSMSVDDFGTGYSSMAYLKHFPIDTIKIDKAFVDDISDGSSDAVIVRAIVGLASGLKLKTVAEGIENREQLDFLRRCGCDQVQGFYLYKPMDAGQIELLLRSGKTAYAS
ncbi:MAG: EAL domain-containing protein, partial [Pseudomonadota bacterium]